jgi:arginyl-tRNA synthetase
MEKRLQEILAKALRQLNYPLCEIIIESPRDESFGDLATPLAMSLAKPLKKPPKKIAQEIIDVLDSKDTFETVEIAGPGFINFTLSKQYLHAEIRNLLEKGSDYLREDIGKGKRVQIEFISANPTGPLHLGHGRGAAMGAALANLLEAGGYKVEKEYYINDAGKQVELLGLSVFAAYKILLGIDYPFPEDGYKGEYIKDIAQGIVKKIGNKYSNTEFEEAKDFFTDFSYKLILEEIKKDLKQFGIIFDTWQSEKELFDKGEVEKAISDLKSKGYIYDKDGAQWFKASEFGDEKDRVIKKQDGTFTYFTSDIAYHRKKIERKFDELIDIWGADHHGYIPRMQAVIQALGYPKESLKVLLVQMVTLLRGGKPVQMSKRSGEFITLKEVIDEVGADTTKFIFLTRSAESHLEFDLEVAKAQSSENPVFYVQYANARINSIFSHAKEQGVSADKLSDAALKLLVVPEELRLIKKLQAYPMVFENAVLTHEPHKITFYLQELAGLFHPYYHKYKVVTENKDITIARLALCEAIRVVLKDGFEILGLSAPEKM